MVCIAYGYIIFLLYLVVGLVGCCFLGCYICALGRGGSNAFNLNNNAINSIPYLNAISSLKKRNFNEIKDKNMDSCAICLMDYQPNDEVSELNCDSRHYFHSACVQDWLKRK